jgi:hypothetical protein
MRLPSYWCGIETWEEKSSKMRTEPSAEVSGSAVAQGELGDTRARDWAEVQESMARPFYEAVLGKTAIRPIVLEGSAVNGLSYDDTCSIGRSGSGAHRIQRP